MYGVSFSLSAFLLVFSRGYLHVMLPLVLLVCEIAPHRGAHCRFQFLHCIGAPRWNSPSTLLVPLPALGVMVGPSIMRVSPRLPCRFPWYNHPSGNILGRIPIISFCFPIFIISIPSFFWGAVVFSKVCAYVSLASSQI